MYLEKYPTTGTGFLLAFRTVPDKFCSLCKILIPVPDNSVGSVRFSYPTESTRTLQNTPLKTMIK